MVGTNDSYLNVPISLPPSYTKAAWVYAASTVGFRNIMTNGTYGAVGVPGTNYGGYGSNILWLNGGTLEVKQFLTGGSHTLLVGGGTVTAGTWTHVVETYDYATNTYTFYKNGVLVGSTGGVNVLRPGPSTGLSVGAYTYNNGVWSGYMDDVEMWSGALSALQVQLVTSGNIGMDEILPTAPTNLVATPGSGSVSLSWSGVTAFPVVSGYIIQYKFDTGSTWTGLPLSSFTTGSVTGLINGLVYNFRVNPVSRLGTGDYSSVSGLPRWKVIYFQILSAGQSLALGTQSTASTITQPYNNLALSTGAAGGGRGWTGSFTPLLESSTESPSSSMANSLSAYSGLLSFYVAVGLHAQGSTAYSGIKKGSVPYGTGTLQAARTKLLAEASGGVYVPLAVTLIHGEEDSYNGNTGYEANLQQLQSDYQNDTNTLLGTTGVTLPLFISQMSAGWSGDIAVAQYKAHKNNPGKIILIGPKYQYTYYTGGSNPGVHLRTSTGYKQIGEMFAKVMQRMLLSGQVPNISSSQIWSPLAGQTWDPLMPTAVSRVANIITVTYHIPVGTLAIDTGNVAQRTNYGFEFYQSGGATNTISSVVLTGNNTQVQITLNGTPTGSNQLLRYAYSCAQTVASPYPYPACGGADNGSMVGGNIRDTDTSVSPNVGSTGLPLYDWGVTFEESISSVNTPNAPTNVVATGGSGQATITFSGSTDDGGSSVLYYIVTSSTGNITATGSGSPITITGLTGGISYTFTVAGVNAIGTGTASSASNSVIPTGVPGAPTSISASTESGSTTISFSAPTSSGGSTISGYYVRSSTGLLLASSGSSAITITGLTNGVSYTFYVSAVNGVGEGTSGSVSTTPATLPGAPTSISASTASGSTVISFSAPTNSGGSTISGYYVRSSTGLLLVSSGSSAITITGLTNGVSYTFYVSAVNGVGEGTSGSVSATPVGLPNAPTNITASGLNRSAIINFSGSTYSGGSTILYYVVTSSTGNITATGSSSPITITGLTNGISYTFTVAAVTAVGVGATGSSLGSTIAVGVPGVPSNINAAGTSATITVAFSGVLDDGGTGVTAYKLRSATGVLITTVTSSPITLTGLIDGATYSYFLSAVNGVGEGTSGAITVTIVTPPTVPTAPTSITGSVGTSGQVSIVFSGPSNNGGLIVDYYTVRSTTGYILTTGATSPLIVSGLTNGVSYTFHVSATNGVGEGATGSVNVVPIGPANAPSSISAVPGISSATISFSGSSYSGGSTILYYVVTSSTGNITATGSGSPITVNGLTSGVTYSFSVSAVNGAGVGASGWSTGVIPGVMNISSLAVSLGSGYASFTWISSLPSSTRIQYGIGTGYGSYSIETDTGSRVTSHAATISGLFACTSYHYRIVGNLSGALYTGTDTTFVSTGCANNARVLSTGEQTIVIAIGGTFAFTSSVSTTGELVVPASISLTGSSVTFQSHELSASGVIALLGTPSSSLLPLASFFDMKAYLDTGVRISSFDTGISITLAYSGDSNLALVDESSVSIYSYEEDGTGRSQLPQCVVNQTAHTVTCTTTHFSIFAIFGTSISTSSNTNTAGQNGYVGLKKDVCPLGDTSTSYYDGVCNNLIIVDVNKMILHRFLSACADSTATEELQSYCFALSIGSTTQKTFALARYDQLITRQEVSKIMSEFAIKILGKTPNMSKTCVIKTQTDDSQLMAYMQTACRLGLMNMDRPTSVLTRGEYVTILSRMLYGKTYEQTQVESEAHPFYEHHMDKIYKEGIIKMKKPELPSQRYVLFLTLYRLAQKLVTNE